jgi:protein-disulfide isomerase
MAMCAATACAQGADSDAAGTPEIVAKFADQEITAAELEQNEELQRQLISIRQQEYDLKKQYIERMVFDRLVELAAEGEGLTSEEYLRQNVVEKSVEPNEQQINAIMTQYRARLDPDPEKAREQVVAALKQQVQGQAQAMLKDKLFAEAGVQVLLEPLRFDVVVAEHHPSRGGSADALVVLVEYTDFQCPFCSRVQPTLDAIIERYGDNVQHVFKQLPLAMHAEARLAAEASLCAADQGRFWELHDWLFSNSKNISKETLTKQAAELELDEAVFTECIDDKLHSAEVQQDMIEAQSFGISGTPGFVINGRALRGAQPMDAFVEVINDELRRAGVEVPAEPVAAEEASAEDAPTEEAATSL